MKLLKALILAIFFFSLNTFGQVQHLQKIEAELMEGKKDALFKIGNYFDSSEKVIEFLGYHRIETTESEIAKRMVLENCIFTESEIVITPKTSKNEFLNFLKKNQDKITFSPLANAFLITPLENRKIDFEVVEVLPNKKDELKKKYRQFIGLDWVLRDQINTLIISRNSASLLKIASHLFKLRNRYNRYYFEGENDIGLLQYLTGTQIVVRNNKNEFTYHIEEDYYPESQLNLLIFFAKFYRAYQWNQSKSVFEHPEFLIKPQPKERALFEKLTSPDNSIAQDAFLQLTESNPNLVVKLAQEYEQVNIDNNRSLPLFPYRFSRQLALLTDYCRKNEIDYQGSEKLKNIIEKLKTELSYSNRYRLENEIIEKLSLAETTAFEYWALIYSSKWAFTYSAGRILDKVYGRNWEKLLADEKQLKLYLKKAKLFNRLGIAGLAYNKYLDKFMNAPKQVLERLAAIKTPDSDMIEQIEKILSLKDPYQNFIQKETIDQPVAELETKLKAFVPLSPLPDKEKDELIRILSEISYEQIGMAVKYMENIEFENPSHHDSKFAFLMEDWGFELVGDFDDDAIRKEFLENYAKMSQSELYAYYLIRNGFDFQTPDKSLDFDKIYEILKYDEVEAFVAGGGRRDYHLYSLIKLLENEFKTTLNFSNKLCKARNYNSCSIGPRNREWMKFLSQNGHLKLKHNEPTSFTYR